MFGYYVFCVCYYLCVYMCLFPVCHLVSLDESILGLEGGYVPGHFQDGGWHSWHSDRLRGHRWGCRRRGVLLKCCWVWVCVCVCLSACTHARSWVLEWEVGKICSTFPIRMGLRQYLVTPLHTYASTLSSVHLRLEKRPYHPISSSPPSLFCLPLPLPLLILTSHSSACDMYGLHAHTLHTPLEYECIMGGSVRLWKKK